MLSNLERIALMRERTKRARERLDKLEAARKHELERDEATEFCATVQDWHVYLWRVFNVDLGCSRQRLSTPGKIAAMGLSREWTLGGVSAREVQRALFKAHEDWKASRKKPKAPKPEGSPNRVYTNSPDFTEDQQHKRIADSVAETVAVLILAAAGYVLLIA